MGTAAAAPAKRVASKAAGGAGKKPPRRPPRERTPSSPQPPRVPDGLGAKGKRVWQGVVSKYELGGHELRILEDACREADLVDRIDRMLKNSDLMVEGSMGQLVASPLVTEIRQHRMTFQKLIAALKLPEDEEDGQAPATDRTTSARAAALTRWRGGAA